MVTSAEFTLYGKGGNTMMDILYIGGTLVFFGLTWLFVVLCERV
jgi:hypothetical protein